MAIAVPRRVKPVIDFAIQIVVGATAFAVVFLVAVMLAGLIKLVERFVTLPPWLETSVGYVELVIWVLDLVGLALFLLSEIATLARKLWIDWRYTDG